MSVTAGAGNQNVYMYLAVEQNQDICEKIQAKTRTESGLTIKVPYPFQYTQIFSTGANNPQIQYTNSQGHHIKRIYWTAYPQSLATPNLTYDKNNLAGATKITAFQTFVNGKAVQQFAYIPQQADDFLYVRERLRKSALQSYNEYLYNWVWEESFCDGRAIPFCQELYPKIPLENTTDGLPIMGSCQYSITATSTANLNNFIFTIFLRDFKIQRPYMTLV